MDNLILWKDVPIIIKNRHMQKEYGDIPVAEIDAVTCKIAMVHNQRGLAYAARKRLKYRKNKKYEYRE